MLFPYFAPDPDTYKDKKDVVERLDIAEIRKQL